MCVSSAFLSLVPSLFTFFFFNNASLGGDWPGEVSHADAFQLTTIPRSTAAFCNVYTRHCEICVPYGTWYRVLKTFQKWKRRYIYIYTIFLRSQNSRGIREQLLGRISINSNNEFNSATSRIALVRIFSNREKKERHRDTIERFSTASRNCINGNG